jgi:K+-transporting ATPase ATPase B chain
VADGAAAHDSRIHRHARRSRPLLDRLLSILLAGLTIVFLAVVVTLRPFAEFAGTDISITVLIALLVALIPTTIGALLSAIGIAGMDRLVRRTRPPNPVSASIAPLTAPHEAAVVMTTKSAVEAAPKRCSLPSMLMPAIPAASIAGVEPVSAT